MLESDNLNCDQTKAINPTRAPRDKRNGDANVGSLRRASCSFLHEETQRLMRYGLWFPLISVNQSPFSWGNLLRRVNPVNCRLGAATVAAVNLSDQVQYYCSIKAPQYVRGYPFCWSLLVQEIPHGIDEAFVQQVTGPPTLCPLTLRLLLGTVLMN